MLLEPYAKQRDVAYIVVAPDNDFILTQLLGFFKELSTIYELLKLGRHCPISKTLRDGIMRVGKKAAQKVADKPVDDWFTFLGMCSFHVCAKDLKQLVYDLWENIIIDNIL